MLYNENSSSQALCHGTSLLNLVATIICRYRYIAEIIEANRGPEGNSMTGGTKDYQRSPIEGRRCGIGWRSGRDLEKSINSKIGICCMNDGRG
jgi:hypothetical protein